MLYKNWKIHFRIINVWLCFVLVLVIASNLPHDNIPILSWLNFSIYFMLFLQCLYIYKKDSNNKSIFLNIGVMSIVHSLSIINLFIGDHDLMGNDTLGYYIDVYLNFVLIFLFAFSIIYICIKYLFKEYSVLTIYGITLSIIIPIFLWHFYPYLLNKSYILRSDDSLLYRRLLYFDFLPLFFILYYGFVLYKHDWSLGEHINTIMVCFFIMVLMDVTNMLGYIYKITIFPLTQYVLLLILTFFLITLFRRLNHTYSEFGQFYDKLVVSGNTMGVPIKRKKDAYVGLIDFAKSYFYQRRNTLGFITLLTVFCVNYFDVSPFLKLNLVAISLGILVLFFYLTALYQKRVQKGRLLNVNRSS